VITSAVQELRETVANRHRELTRYSLVAWTAGKVSARVPNMDLMVIKPSGVSYDELTPESMIVCDLEGKVIDGDWRRRATQRRTRTSTVPCRTERSGQARPSS